jgi:endonuclease/exonuclease/phosphatase family metal-dependent hydrolase
MGGSQVLGFWRAVGGLAALSWLAAGVHPVVAQSAPLPSVRVVESAAVTGEPEAENTAPLRYLSYNIRYATEADGPDAWRHRADTVATTIAVADVAGLQEVLHSQVADLQERLADHDWWGVGRDDGASAGEYVPIFYRRERFERVDGGHFWLSLDPQRPGSRSWDAAITRMVSWLELRDRTTQQVWLVLNTHYDHRGEQARQESSRVIRQWLIERQFEGPTVVMGDLNANPDSAAFRLLAGDPDQPFRLSDSYTSVTVNPEPIGTWNAFRNTQPARIDYIFTAGPIRIVSAAILDPRTPQGRFGSDHHPVEAVLELVGDR